jgi:ABC-type amino acid transport substrate-binding protein
MKKLALSLSLALALSSVSTVFAAIPQKIRIGTDPTYAPFESKNAQGNWSVLISIWQKSCVSVLIPNVPLLKTRWMR